jgi:hypothetical protein
MAAAVRIGVCRIAIVNYARMINNITPQRKLMAFMGALHRQAEGALFERKLQRFYIPARDIPPALVDSLSGMSADIGDITSEIVSSDVDPQCGCPLQTTGGASQTVVGSSRPDNIHAPAADVEWPIAELAASTCECAESIKQQDGQPCSSDKVIDTIIEFVRDVGGQAENASAAKVAEGVSEGTLPDGPSTEAKAVRIAAAVLGCTSESCVISHPQFASFARKKGISRRIEQDKALRFKAAGPRNTAALLNNFNIDETLQRWARAFPELFNYPFAMSDFDQTHENLDVIDPADIVEGRIDLDLGPGAGIVRRPAPCIACVLNTDTSRGRGKHWVAIFADTRPRGGAPWTVEYWNSAGRAPFASAARWLEKAKASLAQLRSSDPKKYGNGPVVTVPVTEVDHQLGDVQCGMYALYYIRARLEGKPISFFQGDRITDDVMGEFRKYVFRDSK